MDKIVKERLVIWAKSLVEDKDLALDVTAAKIDGDGMDLLIQCLNSEVEYRYHIKIENDEYPTHPTEHSFEILPELFRITHERIIAGHADPFSYLRHQFFGKNLD